jgi:DNA-binding NarL/FixJ family response regulator
MEVLASTSVSLVVADLDLQDRHGFTLISAVKAQHPTVEVVVYSRYSERVYAHRALQLGASAYLMKTREPAELAEALGKVHEGQLYVTPCVVARMLQGLGPGSVPSAHILAEAFTDQELAVFQMMGEGYTPPQIADRLCLSMATIAAYRRELRNRLNVGTDAELIGCAVEWLQHEAMRDGTRKQKSQAHAT